MSTVTVLPNSTEFSHPYGDLMFGKTPLFSRVESLRDMSFTKELSPLLLSYVNAHPWDALFYMENIDKAAFSKIMIDSQYECPYTKRVYFSLIPTVIWTKNAAQYLPKDLPSHLTEMACDNRWNLDQYEEELFDGEISTIQLLLLGSGYTTGTRMCDGSPSLEQVVMNLSNDDKLVFSAYIWHNK